MVLPAAARSARKVSSARWLSGSSPEVGSVGDEDVGVMGKSDHQRKPFGACLGSTYEFRGPLGR